MSYNGSIWRKWDLHIHTPASSYNQYNNDWDKFISDLEEQNNYPNGSVIGICDYCTIEGYKKVLEYKSRGRLSNIEFIIPVIEFRINQTSGTDKTKNINLHTIIDPKCENIDRILSSLKDINSNNYVNEISEKHLIIVDATELKKELDKHCEKKHILFLGKNEFDVINQDLLGVSNRDLQNYMLNDISFLSNSSPDIDKAKNNKEYCANTFSRPYFHFSDSHYFSNSVVNNKLGRSFTWIKGDACFETLRQALISYSSRVFIGEEHPIGSLSYIENINIDCCDEMKINDIPFCFSNTKQQINFNKGLTCIIGGRGSGKSVLLKSIAINNGENILNIDREDDVFNFLKENKNKFILSGSKNYEYFGQNQIETLYKDNIDKLHQTIKEKLLNFWKSSVYTASSTTSTEEHFFDIIEECLNNNKDILTQIQNNIENLKNLKKINENLFNIEKNLSSYNQIISTINSEEYRTISKEINDTITKQKENKYSIDNYNKAIKYINDFPIFSDDDIKTEEYKNKYLDIKKTFDILKKEYQYAKYNDDELCEKIEMLKIKLKIYLKERNISEENINNSLNAQEQVNNLIQQKKILEIQQKKIIDTLIEFDTLKATCESSKQNFEKKLDRLLRMTQEKFRKNESDEIKIISFNYTYDNNYVEQEIFKYINENLTTSINLTNFQKLYETIDFSDKFISNLKDKDMLTAKYVFDFLSNDINKQLYDLYLLKYSFNFDKYIFDILYKGKSLEKLSFGQRATAVLLTILYLGTIPLIIDEPETHLDQKMIAEDLVKIIKTVKENRQLIFATHNANIVINGDADLIIHLKQDENSSNTKIETYSIENIDKRDDLLILEGCRDAFKAREEHYNI